MYYCTIIGLSYFSHTSKVQNTLTCRGWQQGTPDTRANYVTGCASPRLTLKVHDPMFTVGTDCNWTAVLYAGTFHDIANQLYFDKKLKIKKNFILIPCLELCIASLLNYFKWLKYKQVGSSSKPIWPVLQPYLFHVAPPLHRRGSSLK